MGQVRHADRDAKDTLTLPSRELISRLAGVVGGVRGCTADEFFDSLTIPELRDLETWLNSAGASASELSAEGGI